MDRRSRELLHEIVDWFLMITGSSPAYWALDEADARNTIAETVLIDPIGQPICLGDLRGQPIVLSFWRASSAQSCDNIAAVEQLAAELGDLADRVKFLFVSIRTKEYPDDLAALRQQGSMRSTYRWENRDADQVRVFFKGRWSWKVPNTLLISPDGDIVDSTCGTMIDPRSYLQTIRTLLSPAHAAA